VTYILIAAFLTNFGVSSVSQEFNTKEACESAKVGTAHHIGNLMVVTAECYPKGQVPEVPAKK
jgi:hypothetical protein